MAFLKTTHYDTDEKPYEDREILVNTDTVKTVKPCADGKTLFVFLDGKLLYATESFNAIRARLSSAS